MPLPLVAHVGKATLAERAIRGGNAHNGFSLFAQISKDMIGPSRIEFGQMHDLRMDRFISNGGF